MQEKIQVTVVEGNNLKGSDVIGKSDPYVCLSLDRQNRQRTRTLQGAGQNAYWNQSIELYANPGQNQLFIEVYNENIGVDQFIGDAILQLPQAPHQDQWVQIHHNGSPAGNIHLIINKSQGHGYQTPIQQPQAYPSYPSYGEQPPRYDGPPAGFPYQPPAAGHGSAPPPPVPAGPPGYGQPPSAPLGFAQPPPAAPGYGQPPPAPLGFAQPPQGPPGYAQPPAPSGYPNPYMPQGVIGHDAHSKDKKDKGSHAAAGHAQPPSGYPNPYMPQGVVGHDAHSKDKKDKKGSHAVAGHAQPPSGYPNPYMPQGVVGHDAHSKDNSHAAAGHAQPHPPPPGYSAYEGVELIGN
ncbi:7187_t:CDS:2 [Paraglomus occultum]|uniref:7187_t:CDS:1 n=1 Tax=Paraglomus occultum TaxID=144539 RepID=A0A9N8VN35_9GLOM|nr:7187_t:CDS:2 [Paraglomus occultum]